MVLLLVGYFTAHCFGVWDMMNRISLGQDAKFTEKKRGIQSCHSWQQSEGATKVEHVRK